MKLITIIYNIICFIVCPYGLILSINLLFDKHIIFDFSTWLGAAFILFCIEVFSNPDILTKE